MRAATPHRCAACRDEGFQRLDDGSVDACRDCARRAEIAWRARGAGREPRRDAEPPAAAAVPPANCNLQVAA